MLNTFAVSDMTAQLPRAAVALLNLYIKRTTDVSRRSAVLQFTALQF